MTTSRLHLAIDRLASLELGTCRAIQAHSEGWIQRGLGVVSRLGDGWLWGAVVVALWLAEGARALSPTLQMAAAALVGLPLYRLLKRGVARPRPCHAGVGLRAVVPALDRHSFPSGHTLHAVAFTIVIAAHQPALAWVLAPFAALVALSRVVLGLHYPSDVLAGGVLGTLLGLLAIHVPALAF